LATVLQKQNNKKIGIMTF